MTEVKIRRFSLNSVGSTCSNLKIEMEMAGALCLSHFASISDSVRDVRAEKFAHFPNWFDLPIILLECELGRALPKSY